MNTASPLFASDLHTQRPRDEEYLGPKGPGLRYHTNVEVDHVTMGSRSGPWDLKNVSTSCLHSKCQMWVLAIAGRISSDGLWRLPIPQDSNPTQPGFAPRAGKGEPHPHF